jgi:hypothetical protein
MDFRGKLVGFVHSSILLRIRASSKHGAIHADEIGLLNG